MIVPLLVRPGRARSPDGVKFSLSADAYRERGGRAPKAPRGSNGQDSVEVFLDVYHKNQPWGS